MSNRKRPLSHLLAGGAGVVACGLLVFHFSRPAPAAKPLPALVSTATGPILEPEESVHARYAGSETCRECHAAEYESWKNSNHGLAEREVDMERDKQAFSPKRSFTHGGDTSTTFLDADGLAKIITRGLGGSRQTYTVARVIGNDPLRQFLIPAPGGRMQTCDVSYDPAKDEWFDVYGEEERNPGDWGHWTGQGMNWNAMCAACHNTRLRKNYEPRSNSYHTTMVEMSIGCEACHGPMKDHVEWQRKPPLDKAKDPTIKKFSRDQVMETCAACHARRGEVSGDLIPGEPFHDHFSLTLTDETDTYHADGQVRDENYEYSSFLSSKMHHAGVRCVDCHDPHAAQRLIPGNMLCMRCHSGGSEPPAPVIDPVAHSRHGPNSTGNDCTSCHMPITVYMERDPRHDHSFSSPDPLLTRELGIPNACNKCHTDKDVDWAIDAHKRLFGDKPDSPARIRARLVGAARRGEPAARDGLIELLKTEPVAAWQASFCHLLGRWVLDPVVAKILIDQTSNKSPLVREAAVRSLVHATRQNVQAVRTALQPLLDDPARAVRVAAAWALCDTLDLNSRAGRELSHMLDLNADQPTGRMQLAQFASLRGDTPAAIRQMRKAIEWDPLSPPFYHDLAIMLSSSGDSAGAVEQLREAVRLDPENPDYHYTLALALNETGATAESLASLEKTVALNPGHGRAWYNLGLARSGMNQPAEAIAALRRGEAADPGDPGIPYARATIHARLGQKEEAIAAATRALGLRPDFMEARQLINALSR
jgi:tetratricopeptide (TPR) repeat protein